MKTCARQLNWLHLHENDGDWTVVFDRGVVVEGTNRLIDALIESLHAARLYPFAKHRLTGKELALLLRFPLHVCINIFIERLLRVTCYRLQKTALEIPRTISPVPYAVDTSDSAWRAYFDLDFNRGLIRRLGDIVGLEMIDTGSSSCAYGEGEARGEANGIKVGVKQAIKAINDKAVELLRPKRIGEYSNWMKDVLPFWQNHSFSWTPERIGACQSYRREVRRNARETFVRVAATFIKPITPDEIDGVGSYFAEIVDRMIPISLVEALDQQFAKCERMIADWKVVEAHSFTGFFYNEFFKIFTILAKRKKAHLVCHAHGASNFISTFKDHANELRFLDYYFMRGKANCRWMKSGRTFNGLTIAGIGSPYLKRIPRWKSRKKRLSGQKLLLFAASPFMTYMSDLEEATPEDNFQHKRMVLEMLEILMEQFTGLRLLYKPFPMAGENDPVGQWIRTQGDRARARICHDRPVDLFARCDLVLWDSISTGFSESINSGVPTVVFQPAYEYDSADQKGKLLNDLLAEAGLLFDNVDRGVACCANMITGAQGNSPVQRSAIERFKFHNAMPVSRSEYRLSMRRYLRRGTARN